MTELALCMMCVQSQVSFVRPSSEKDPHLFTTAMQSAEPEALPWLVAFAIPIGKRKIDDYTQLQYLFAFTTAPKP